MRKIFFSSPFQYERTFSFIVLLILMSHAIFILFLIVLALKVKVLTGLFTYYILHNVY